MNSFNLFILSCNLLYTDTYDNNILIENFFFLSHRDYDNGYLFLTIRLFQPG